MPSAHPHRPCWAVCCDLDELAAALRGPAGADSPQPADWPGLVDHSSKAAGTLTIHTHPVAWLPPSPLWSALEPLCAAAMDSPMAVATAHLIDEFGSWNATMEVDADAPGSTPDERDASIRAVAMLAAAKLRSLGVESVLIKGSTGAVPDDYAVGALVHGIFQARSAARSIADGTPDPRSTQAIKPRL